MDTKGSIYIEGEDNSGKQVIESDFEKSMRMWLPIVEKHRRKKHSLGRKNLVKRIRKVAGTIYEYDVYNKQLTYKGVKKRFDAENATEWKKKAVVIKKEIDLLATSFNPDDKKATYSQAFTPFLDDEEVKPESLARRASIFRTWIEPQLGKNIVYETNGKQVDDFFKSVKKKANEKRSLKNPPSMIKEIYNVLNAFYNFCQDSQRFILENPTMPKTRKWINKNRTDYIATLDDKKGIDVSQVIMLMKHVIGTSYEIVYHWMCYHGMRSSEALAIEWKHIDFKNNRVLIRQQTGRNSKGRFIKPYTKTNEKRYVPLSNLTIALLLQTPFTQRDGLVSTKPDGSIDVEADFHKRVYLKNLFELGLIESRKIASPTIRF